MIESSIKNRIVSGKAWADVLAIVALILLHPVLYRLDMVRGIYSPDVVAYIEFAEHFLSEGLLYIERGMADQGNVLPPLYPFFILMANFFVGDFVVAAVFVSSVATIVASIVFYFIIRKFGNPYFALLGTLGIQLNYQLNLWAITPLTEASFIMIVACFLWLTLHVLSSNRTRVFVVLGALLALIFFTRQVGIILFPFILLILFLAESRRFVIKSAGMIVGMVLLLAPYGFAVQEQGKQIEAELSAFEPTWSKRDVILIDEVDQNVQDYLRRLNNTPSENYGGVYVKRRLLRQLLPDSSAMLQDVKIEPPGQATNAITARLVHVWSSLDKFSGNLAENIRHVVTSIGPFVSAVFLITLTTPLWVGMNRNSLLARYLVGGFVLYYLFAISLLTGLVERYVQILAPFILLHIVVETVYVLSVVQRKIRGIPISPLIFAVAVAVCAYSQPANYSDVGSLSQERLAEFSASNFRQFVEPRDPVLSMVPFHAYAAGGAWRTMPNDSLEKIAIYAAREEIPWLLVVRDSRIPISAQKLTQQWYRDPDLMLKYKDLIQLRAMSSDGKSFLFQFKRD